MVKPEQLAQLSGDSGSPRTMNPQDSYLVTNAQQVSQAVINFDTPCLFVFSLCISACDVAVTRGQVSVSQSVGDTKSVEV